MRCLITRVVSAWRATAVTCLVAAVGLPLAARALAGPPGAVVHVRWGPAVGAESRQTLEARFRLADGQHVEGSTWRYDLVDPSPENIRDLLSLSAVADTHHIDRPRSVVDAAAVRTGRRQRLGSGDVLVLLADGLAVALAMFAGLLAFLALSETMPALGAIRRGVTLTIAGLASIVQRSFRTCQSIVRELSAATAPVGHVLTRAVPEVDAATAGLFRIAFGTTVVVYFAFHAVDAGWLANTFDSKADGAAHAWVLERLGERPYIVDAITPWLIAFGVAFTAGFFTRLTYGLFVAGVLLWAWVAMSVQSTHPHGMLVLTIVSLLPSQWHAAWSLDAWRQRRRGRVVDAAPSKIYGYSVWVPILTLGVGFAAAAWAKLSVPGSWTSWVLNGTIAYHVVTDSVDAPVDWGLQLARFPTLAVLLSFGAVAIEALLITAAFLRNELWRLAMGVAAAALFAGITLLMGIMWTGWWIPLLAFLPWDRWSRRLGSWATPMDAATPRRDVLTAAQLVAVVAVIAQQVFASTLKFERAPMFSPYEMYSRSYTSRADYNARIRPVYDIVLAGDTGRRQLPCNPHDEFVRDFEAAVKGSTESRTRVWRALRGCGADPARIREVTLVGHARTFDWDRLTFTMTHELSLGPLAVEQATAGP
jgi:hypothetical protein